MGDIDSVAITGTPVIDLASRRLFFDAMTTPDGGATAKYLIFALDVDTGTVQDGWPVDMDAKASFQSTSFTSNVQNHCGALAVVGGMLYLLCGGFFGDCGSLPRLAGWRASEQPSHVGSWATGVTGGDCFNLDLIGVVT